MSALVLSACGGGGSTNAVVAPPPGPATTATRQAAADATVAGNALCSSATLGSYYWEIGDVNGMLGHGAVGSTYTATTKMRIASASKWLYSSYVYEKNGGTLDPVNDVPYLNFTSGYSNFGSPLCPGGSTPNGCLALINVANGKPYGFQDTAEANAHTFHYDSGHMEKHASNTGLGTADTTGIAAAVSAGIGVNVAYQDPTLAGGGYMSASDYAVFLRKLLSGSTTPLRMGTLLDNETAYRVTTYNTAANPPPVSPIGSTSTDAVVGPVAWQYGIGHWIESGSNLSPADDGSYSSGGALGFYPWVTADRTLYGILAREVVDSNEGLQSALCGRLIRKAWLSNTPQ